MGDQGVQICRHLNRVISTEAVRVIGKGLEPPRGQGRAGLVRAASPGTTSPYSRVSTSARCTHRHEYQQRRVADLGNPLQGAYLVTVIAKDSTTGLSGQGVLKFVIGPPKPPVVAGATITGKVGNPLNFAISVTSPNPVTYAPTCAASSTRMSIRGDAFLDHLPDLRPLCST